MTTSIPVEYILDDDEGSGEVVVQDEEEEMTHEQVVQAYQNQLTINAQLQEQMDANEEEFQRLNTRIQELTNEINIEVDGRLNEEKKVALLRDMVDHIIDRAQLR